MSARAKPKHTRRNSSSCARMRPIRSALRRKRPPNKCTASAPVTRRGLYSTIGSTPKPLADPFLVSAIFHDESFTYIQCAAREKPALYEIKDGRPSLLSFQFENGVYIAAKVIDSGYLAIGGKKLLFTRHAAAN